MIKRIFSALLLIGFIAAFSTYFVDFEELSSLTGVSQYYVENSKSELGAMNVVTSIVVTYRGLDTLGEVAVLFVAATGIAVLFRRKKKYNEIVTSKPSKREASEILFTGARLIMPFMIMFGIYIFINGHLSPGGGFQGGAVIATAILLLFLSDSSYKMNHKVFGIIESLSGFSYIIIGLLGVFLLGDGNFLNNRILPLGEFGTILSAGVIPIIYSLVGLKVGTELVSILDNMKGEIE
jgi:multicomponent Na+:H+ antiporter subunit B